MASETIFPDEGSYGTARAVWNKALRKLGEWGAEHTFAADEITVFEGVIYVSLQGSNINKSPDTEAAWWERYMPADAVPCVTSTSDPTTGENTAAGYANCTIWLNSTNETGWIKTGETASVATWVQFGSGSSTVTSVFGLTGAVGINSLSSPSIAVAEVDGFALYDTSLGQHRAVTRTQVLNGVVRDTRQIIAGLGLSGTATLAGDPTLALDPSELSAVTPEDADSMVILDNSGAGPARVLLSAFLDYIAAELDSTTIPYSPNVTEAIESENIQDAIDEVAEERLRSDFTALPEATVVDGGDLVAIRSAATGVASRMTVDDLLEGVSGGGVSSVFGVSETSVDFLDFADLTERRLTARVLVYDDNEVISARNRSMSIAGLLTGLVDEARLVDTASGSGLDGGGSLAGDRSIELEFNDLAVAPNGQTTDTLAIYRPGNDTHYIASMSQLANAVEGLIDPEELVYDNSGTALDSTTVGEAITELDAETLRSDLTLLSELVSAASDDLIPIWDTDAGAIKYIEKGNLVAGGGTVDSVFGISEATITISDLWEETTAAGTDEIITDKAGATTRMTRANFLAGYVADTRTITAGAGLTGGGDLSGNRSLALDITGLAELSAAPDDTDELLVSDAGTMKRMAWSQIKPPRVTMVEDSDPDVGTHNSSTGYPDGSIWYRGDVRRLSVYCNDGVSVEQWEEISKPRDRLGAASVAPDADDDETLRYRYGSLWTDTDRDNLFWICDGASEAAASWLQITNAHARDDASAPAVTDDLSDQYRVGSTWVHDVAGDGSQRDLYGCMEDSEGAASWAWMGGDRTVVHAARTGSQAVALASTVTVIYDVETTDANSEYVSGTGIFTAKAAGLYQVAFSAEGTPITSAHIVASTFGSLEFLPNSGSVTQGSAIMSLAAAETVRVQATFSEAGNVVGDEERTWLQITRIG